MEGVYIETVATSSLAAATRGVGFSPAVSGQAYCLDDGSVEEAFNVTALPATYLIDRSGRVAASYIGVVDAANLQANVKALLAER